MVDFSSIKDQNEAVAKYSESLINAIKIVKNQDFDPSGQIQDILEYRNKDRIVQQWINFDNSLVT